MIRIPDGGPSDPHQRRVLTSDQAFLTYILLNIQDIYHAGTVCCSRAPVAPAGRELGAEHISEPDNSHEDLMVDVLTPEQRRLNMSRIRGRDTKPELLLRRGLHAAGLRFRLHAAYLPGKPDIVFRRYRALILVHGCFWHGHDCPRFRLPKSRTEFWAEKIAGNQARDRRTIETLQSKGWRVLVVWECSLRGPARWNLEEVLTRCKVFVKGGEKYAELAGKWPAGTNLKPSVPLTGAV